jgi:bifunctional non-homologous end joining protein LigD
VITVSNADRIVFPEIGKTKGDVVAYYERIAPRIFPHVVDRPLSIRRYPKGLAEAGFFQKNVPAHYPESIGRFEVPRSKEATKRHKKKGGEREVTVYPVVKELEHLPYVANQGAIELHVPTARVTSPFHPDRLVIDLDPPPGSFDLVRTAAHLVRTTLEEFGLATVPVATGSKGYHLVAAIEPTIDADAIALTFQKLAALLTAKYPDELTTVFRIALRGERVFVDWLRNLSQATVVTPYSLRATPRATVATPIAWDELATIDPNRFTIDDLEALLDRRDPLSELAPADAAPIIAKIDQAFDRSGLVLETFDRFRS